jgi:hypothetical protein
MSSAMGILRWTPETFWRATMYEYTAAMKGHLVAKGVKFSEPSMTREEVAELMAIHERRERKARLRGH